MTDPDTQPDSGSNSGPDSGAETGPPATALRRALRILGDPWTMLILKEAYNGTRRFNDFQRSLNIPRQTLSLRLLHLCREQLLYRRFTSPAQGALDYALTAKAQDLQDAMYAVWLWHQANPGQADFLPFDIVHRDCGHVIGATWRCTSCRGAVTSSSVTIHRSQPEQIETEPRPRLSRRNDASFTAASSQERGTVAASLVGDPACNEILYLLFQQPRHMLGIAQDLALGASIVRDRLDKLMDLGLVQEEAQGRRLLYSILPRAEGFLPLLLAIADWGDRWCNAGQPPPDLRLHDCGEILRAAYACDHCGGWIGRDSLFIRPRQPVPE
ncbi:ArsR family transcriptional regulator [Thalassovita gelatinovora]|nr:ArsR family transcriptional regulator [Thalassovita gelatinovora]